MRLVASPDVGCRLICRLGLVGKCDVAWAVGPAKAAGAVGNAGESDRGDGGWRKFYRFNPRQKLISMAVFLNALMQQRIDFAGFSVYSRNIRLLRK